MVQENQLKLYMLLLGCRPKGRFIEQHDIYFAIGESLLSLVPQIKMFWPEADGKIHIDVWREVNFVGMKQVKVVPDNAQSTTDCLFFLNLGGYKKGEFEEYHYRMLSVAQNLTDAVKTAKETSFYKYTGFKGAVSHIDDKYGIDVDDVYNVAHILDKSSHPNDKLLITNCDAYEEDPLHIGYLTLDKIK